MNYPLQPTERDRERFRDFCKSHLEFLEPDFDRVGTDGHYKSLMTKDLWAVWWAQERERQLLQNLSLSQAAEIQRHLNKLIEVTP